MRRSYQEVLILGWLVCFCLGLEAFALGSSPKFPLGSSAMEEGRYVGIQSPEEIEEEGLGIIESISDPGTIRRMKELGIGPGWCCLEVAAGRGSNARWLAEHVGLTLQTASAN